jgi:putative membrane protein
MEGAMSVIAMIAVGVVAAIHLGIAWLEMFAWEARGPKVFRSLAPELFPKTTVLAANQGLYNAFLAVGLLWALWIGDPGWAACVATFFLLCVAVAGVFGAWTASAPRILLVQTVPAVAGLVLVRLG